MSRRTEKAILAGGCFWGMQDLIRRRPGVMSRGWATREAMSRMPPIETILATQRLSRSPSTRKRRRYRDLLELFFQIHDPTTLNRQGNDVGTSYRSAIFYANDEQRRVAEDTSPMWRRGTLARQGRHRDDPCGCFLGGRAGTPGLLGTLSQRLHLPFPPTRLGPASPQRRGRLIRAITGSMESARSPSATLEGRLRQG